MRIVFLLLFILVGTWRTSGQLIDPVTMRLSTIEEFISLFNGTPEQSELFDIYPIVYKQDRGRIIEGLCDVTYPLDNSLRTALRTFSTQVCLNRSQISWDHIRTFLTGYYKNPEGKEIAVYLTLSRMTPSKNRGNHWIIEEVESPYFHLGDTAKSALPTPFDNEVGFAALLRDGTDYREKVEPGFKADYRALFLFLTSNGYLKLDHISPLMYKIRLDEYTLWVSYRKKPYSSLAGWMITRIDHHGNILFTSQTEMP